jgi:hypothetical protein
MAFEILPSSGPPANSFIPPGHQIFSMEGVFMKEPETITGAKPALVAGVTNTDLIEFSLTSRGEEIADLFSSAESVALMLEVASLRIISPANMDVETAGSIMHSCAALLQGEIDLWKARKIGEHGFYERDVEGGFPHYHVVISIDALSKPA